MWWQVIAPLRFQIIISIFVLRFSSTVTIIILFAIAILPTVKCILPWLICWFILWGMHAKDSEYATEAISFSRFLVGQDFCIGWNQ